MQRGILPVAIVIHEERSRLDLIKIEDDLDLDRIAESGQCFRWKKEDRGQYHIIHREYVLQISPVGEGLYRISCTEDEFRKIWHDYFDLDENYAMIRRRIKEEKDPFLYRACEYGKGIRILRQDPWEMLISFIISQNKNIPAIQKSIRSLCETAGKKKTDPSGDVYYPFPSPEEILSLDDEALKACRLGYRAKYVKAAARDVYGKKLKLEQLRDEALPDALDALMKVYGVGRKVANCVALFGLHQLDGFPEDVWIKRIKEREYSSGYPEEQYRPYNGVYQQYMFYYYRKKDK